MDTGPSAEALVRHAFNATDARDLDRLADLWDEDSTAVFVALDLTLTGEQEFRRFFTELFAAIPDLGFLTEHVHPVSEQIAIGQWRMSGTFSGGPFQGINPTGKQLELRGVDVMRFEGSKVRHYDVYYDGLSFARQIGMLPRAGSGADRAMMAAFNTATKARWAVKDRLSR